MITAPFKSLFVTLLALSSVLTLANAPEVGKPAPAFKLQDQTGAWRSLADYRGKWVVL